MEKRSLETYLSQFPRLNFLFSSTSSAQVQRDLSAAKPAITFLCWIVPLLWAGTIFDSGFIIFDLVVGFLLRHVSLLQVCLLQGSLCQHAQRMLQDAASFQKTYMLAFRFPLAFSVGSVMSQCKPTYTSTSRKSERSIVDTSQMTDKQQFESCCY